MSTELARRDQDAFELGKVFKASGMFKDMRSEAEAVVKILAGREFGLGPLAAMNGIHMVDGKPTLAANLIAGQIKRHPSYDYRVIRREDDGCELEFFEVRFRRTQPPERTSLGTMKFEKVDAERAGLLGKQNWRKYPRDMYFARALTAGARPFCPDVLGGSPIYTAEELGADETPEAIPVTKKFGEQEPNPQVTDADVVEPGKDIVNDITLEGLRETIKASGKTDDEIAWCLLSVGVESLPENPSRNDLKVGMASMTVD
jgi:hypothetical protein